MVASELSVPPSPSLRALAELVGVECDHVDGRGHVHQATDAALRMMLGALDIDVKSKSDIQREWDNIHEERWTRVVEPVLLHYPESRTPLCFPIALPLRDSSAEKVEIEFRLKDEQGKVRCFPMKGSACTPLEDTMIRGTHYVRMQVSLTGRFPFGYYDLMAT
ncbi:MAG: hypothetical protein OEZ57_06450, partial [Nitrospirota bacterium]|nr:hypothetical protein [Nitrospirota bacterium]